MVKKYFLNILFILFAALSLQPSSIIVLKDGREYNGKLISIKEDKVLFMVDGLLNFFNREDVLKINLQKSRRYEYLKNILDIEDNEIKEIWQNSLATNLDDTNQSQNSSFVVLLDKTTYDFKDKQNVTIRLKRAIKILTEDGKDESIQYFYYLKKYFTPNLLYAMSVTEDGNLYPVSESAINDEPINGSYPIYDNLQRVKFGLKNGDIGTTIIWECEINGSFNELDNPFFTTKQLINSYPSKKKIVEVVYPKDMDVDYFINEGLIPVSYTKPQKNTVNDISTLTFTLTDAYEFINDEENSPNDSIVYPSITFAATKPFSDISKECYKAFFDAPTSNEIVNKSKDIVKDVKSSLDKVVSIYDYINRKIKLANVNIDENGYTPTDDATIINSPFLNELDKNYLFTRMVKAIGLNGEMIFYRSNYRSDIQENVGSLGVFDGCASIVIVDGKRYILSFGNQNYAFGQVGFDMDSAEYLSIREGGANLSKLDKIDSDTNKVVYNYGCQLNDDDSILIEKNTQLYGNYQTDFREKRFLSKDESNKWIKKRSSSYGNDTTVLEYKFANDLNDFTKDVSLYEKFLVNNYSTSSGKDIKLFKLPGFSFGSSSVNKSERRFPFDQKRTRSIVYKYKIDLPEGYRLGYMKEDQNFVNDYISYNYKSVNNGNSIEIDINISYLDRIVPKEEYDKLKIVIESLAKLSNEWIIIEK